MVARWRREVHCRAPFKFVGSEAESKYEFLAEGFQSEIISRLYLQKNLLVIAPEAARKAQLAGWSPTEIHGKLNVQYVLSGSLQKDGNRLRIMTQLTDAVTGAVVDTKTLERTIDDYFQLQQEVAVKVVRDVGLVVSKGLETHRGTDNLKALEYHRASQNYAGTSRDKKETDTLVWLLHRSLQEDSMYLSPLIALVSFHFYSYDVGGDTLQLAAGLKALERMIRIDKSSIETQHAQALHSYFVLKNYALAIEQLDAILKRSPYYVGATIRKGFAYRRFGKYQEYLNTNAAVAKVNPLLGSPGMYREFGLDLLAHGQTREAYTYIRELRNTSFVADYYVFSFNHAVLENRWDKLDSLATEAEASADPLFGVGRQKDLMFCKEQLTGFYKRQYRSNLQRFKKNDIKQAAMDSATLLLLMGDSAASRISFLTAQKRHELNYNRTKGSQVGNIFWINLTVCKAALEEPGWKEEFARIKSQLAGGLFYKRYYNGYLMACLLAGENKEAFRLLREWKDENIPYPLTNDYMGPWALVLKDHPLFDPIRNEPGFEELWEGNHLKLKPLIIPKELQVP